MIDVPKPTPQPVPLTFRSDLPDLKATRTELSAVDHHGRTLFVAHDEATSIERLLADDEGGFAFHERFAIGDLFPLPAGDEEIDIEGLAFDPPWLWATGSMSLKRKRAGGDETEAEGIADLAKLKVEPNRYTLVRLPCEQEQPGVWRPVAETTRDGRTLRAALLERGEKDNALTARLHADDHLGPFLEIPSKENGFDIEGLAAIGDRLLLGLRGPVLRGYAMILDVELTELDGRLRLANRDGFGQPYRKHFLDLDGMGIREVRRDPRSDDLLLLAGPSMDCDGTISLWRVPGGVAADRDTLRDDAERLFDIVHPNEINHGRDKAEGLAVLEPDADEPPTALVVYDGPMPERLIGESGVNADRYELT